MQRVCLAVWIQLSSFHHSKQGPSANDDEVEVPSHTYLTAWFAVAVFVVVQAADVGPTVVGVVASVAVDACVAVASAVAFVVDYEIKLFVVD